MRQQLLWIETLLKLTGGLVLALMPRLSARLFGLPVGEMVLWPRLLGAVLIGLAAATYIEGSMPGSRGLGLAGLTAINGVAGLILLGLLLAGGGATTIRGRFALWILTVLLFLLAVIEFRHL